MGRFDNIQKGMYFSGQGKVFGKCLDTYGNGRIYAFAMSSTFPPGEKGTVMTDSITRILSEEDFLQNVRTIIDFDSSFSPADKKDVMARILREIE